jgi:hypothetical protein
MKYDNNKLYLLRDRIDRLTKLTLCPFCNSAFPIVIDIQSDKWYCHKKECVASYNNCDEEIPRSLSNFDSEFLQFLNKG